MAGSGCFAFTSPSPSLSVSFSLRRSLRKRSREELPVSSAALFPGITTITEQEKTRQSRCAPFDYTSPRSDYILYTPRRIRYVLCTSSHAAWTFLWKTPDIERERGGDGWKPRLVPPVYWVTTCLLSSICPIKSSTVVTWSGKKRERWGKSSHGRGNIVEEKCSKLLSFFFFFFFSRGSSLARRLWEGRLFFSCGNAKYLVAYM